MPPIEVLKDMYWVGAVDWNIRDFHGYSVDRGSSYNAFLEVKVEKEIDMGTHTVFIGEVTDGEILHGGEPMTYAYYHKVIKGKSPKAAPTYIED